MDLVSWIVYNYETEDWPIHRKELLQSTADQHNNLITLLGQLETKIVTIENTAALYHSLCLDLHVLTEKTPPCSLAEKALSLEKRINSISQSLKNSWQIGKAEPPYNTACPTSPPTSESSSLADTSPESSSSISEPTRTIPRYGTMETDTLNSTPIQPPTSPPSEREECGRCRGYGTIGGVTCSFCGGQGYWHVSH